MLVGRSTQGKWDGWVMSILGRDEHVSVTWIQLTQMHISHYYFYKTTTSFLYNLTKLFQLQRLKPMTNTKNWERWYIKTSADTEPSSERSDRNHMGPY